MPQAQPIRSERLTGMARGHTVAALENVALGTNDISHSSVERVILPDACILTHFMLMEMTELVKHLLVYPQNMERNMNCYVGCRLQSAVLLALVEKGMNREQAYVLRSSGLESTGRNFHDLISQDARVTQQLSSGEIEACFDPQHHLRHLDQIYQRLGI